MIGERLAGQLIAERILGRLAQQCEAIRVNAHWIEADNGDSLLLLVSLRSGKVTIAFSEEELEDAPQMPDYERLFERRIARAIGLR